MKRSATASVSHLVLIAVLLLVAILLPRAVTSSLPSSTTTTTTLRRTNETTRKQKRLRSACRLFVWDGMSSTRYHVCKRLLRDNVYEGLGGKKFVRIRPNSVLESLYPLSRHSPDRCLICGQSFRSHLTSWWFQRLYTPYDLYLDTIRREGTTFNTPRDGDGHGGKIRPTSGSGVLTYHRLYTKSLIAPPQPPSLHTNQTPLPPNNKSTKITKKHTRTKKKKSPVVSDGTARDNDSLLPSETNDEIRTSGGLRYSVPKMRTDGLGTFRVSMLTVARELVLLDLDAFVSVQRLENGFNEWKKERFN